MGVELGKRSELIHELSYEMVLTLLEHQFSSPVQWIATQNALLDMPNVQRYLEIGPAKTLTSMMKKTISQRFQQGSAENAPACVAFEDELAEINKQPDEDEEDDSAPQGHDASRKDPSQVIATKIPQPVQVAPASAAVVQPRARVTAEIEDVPVLALEALLTIVASNLKTSKANVSTAQSIKFLAKGRSALQNEIIGNLATEFGELPDDAEDTALVELGQALQQTFSGKLGPYLNEWMANKISAKLATSLSVSKIRSRLRESFGLKENRQSSILLDIGFDEIPSRLTDEQESWAMVNRWADSYMRKHGLERAQDHIGQNEMLRSSESQTTMTNPQLAEFGQDLSDLMAKHFKSKTQDQSAKSISAEPQPDATAEHNMEQVLNELGEDFITGIQPYFRPELVYRYDSGWNWAVQDLYLSLSRVIALARTEAKPQDEVQSLVEAESRKLRRRITPRMRGCAEYLVDQWQHRDGEHEVSRHCLLLLQQLLDEDSTREPAPATPDGRTVPERIVTEDGEIFSEQVRVGKLDAKDLNGSWDMVGSSPPPLADQSATPPGSCSTPPEHTVARVCSKDKDGGWETNVELTARLHEARMRLECSSTSLSSGTALIIGAGRRSIGFHVVRQLLELGWRVALCTTRLTLATRKLYSQLYAQVAKPGAELVLLPFNQASVRDITNLVEYINGPLGWEIDHLVPFAALPELGKTLEDLDSTSELAHRIMLTNTLRLIGAVAASKRRRQILNHCTQVLLPLSTNYGQIGGDGLYVESKLGLEALLAKWSRESWAEFVSLCAVRIGWTRGTGLMGLNDAIAAEAETKLGFRTFSANEMAQLLSSVMSPELLEACSLQPLLCDFGGGMQEVQDLSNHMDKIRSSLQTTAEVEKRTKQEAEDDKAASEANASVGKPDKPDAADEPRAKIRSQSPILPERYEDQVPAGTANLRGIIDLDSTVVITGFAEIGSAGSSRTRWELEAHGEFSLEGCVELAWMTGLIKYERQCIHNGVNIGPGWVECESGEPIKDADVKRKLESRIREHTGIRIVNPDQSSNLDPRLRNMLHEVGAAEDLPPFECSPQAAEAFKARHGDGAEILSSDGTTAKVRIRRGAYIFVPKAMNTEYFVGAQLPTGWDASKYGIPDEVLTQASRSSLYVLVAVAEAFICAGITDVYELYKYIHVSDVGNCVSSGAGGATAIQAFHEHRLLGGQVQSDILSESFVGTAAAWVNLMLLSASGPLKTAAGTCASSLESLDTAADLIRNGRAKVCLAGGYDVFTRPVYYEFGEMGAIIDSAQDMQCGRDPSEMSRPFTSTRNGFVLSEGAGIQVVTSASLALEMGLPIYGVVAMTHMAADKIGRSIPAPGRGLLTAAKQAVTGHPCAFMDPKTRAKRIRTSLGHVERQGEADIEEIEIEVEALASQGFIVSAVETQARIDSIKHAVELEKKAVLRELGSNYWRNDPGISPITGALSVFGLGIQDITFASLHGTATKLNDFNECATLDLQLRHLGRHPGNPVFTIAQKSVVGHGVGASGAWALNGALQAMHSGIIPGNRNADNIDKRLEAFQTLLLANENITVDPSQIKAFTVTSFGFGQKGAQVIVAHPRYLYAAISELEYGAYRTKQMKRSRLADRELDRGLHGQGMFKAKDEKPYVGDEYDYLLNPLARTKWL
ncbi:hypothetical protein EDB80DRAFT_651672 [Ilyonectria destructans]|nr:hypothetical protein EDB80DRAFT_651672 [Ilyonectria destructans]